METQPIPERNLDDIVPVEEDVAMSCEPDCACDDGVVAKRN